MRKTRTILKLISLIYGMCVRWSEASENESHYFGIPRWEIKKIPLLKNNKQKNPLKTKRVIIQMRKRKRKRKKKVMMGQTPSILNNTTRIPRKVKVRAVVMIANQRRKITAKTRQYFFGSTMIKRKCASQNSSKSWSNNTGSV